jgi:hypothetical protein
LERMQWASKCRKLFNDDQLTMNHLWTTLRIWSFIENSGSQLIASDRLSRNKDQSIESIRRNRKSTRSLFHCVQNNPTSTSCKIAHCFQIW